MPGDKDMVNNSTFSISISMVIMIVIIVVVVVVVVPAHQGATIIVFRDHEDSVP